MTRQETDCGPTDTRTTHRSKFVRFPAARVIPWAKKDGQMPHYSTLISAEGMKTVEVCASPTGRSISIYVDNVKVYPQGGDA